MKVCYQGFVSAFRSWGSLFAEAAEFASQIGPQRLINISHSEDRNEGVMVVWFWGEEGESGLSAPGA
jgi:hypothetical protein